MNAWEGVPRSVLRGLAREAEGREIAGIDHPMPNGCWRCIGCGKFLRKASRWNQCADCDVRGPEDYC
jgi:hypothetical protein